ncbi:MAG: LarC family nickel insertion protein [Desulfurispora sp.]|uniref:LarC family nickel insertion protein n=1 Tax=Desulfurispora sp. TaxID=3014275 RepID=UPI0040496A47
MATLYLDCFSGISGNMLLGALLDAGGDAGHLQSELGKLSLPEWQLHIERRLSHGISGTYVQVLDGRGRPWEEATGATGHEAHSHCREAAHHHTSFREIRAMLEESSLHPRVQETALAVFTALAQAEGRVHGRLPEDVHFHEVGAVDSIIDIVGAAVLLHKLGVERVLCSPLPTGGGYVRCAHGLLPVPAPATAILLQGVPLRPSAVQAELTTPTGAALVRALAQGFGPLPAGTYRAVGYGLGSREIGQPNALRVFLYERLATGNCYLSWMPGVAGVDGSSLSVAGEKENATGEFAGAGGGSSRDGGRADGHTARAGNGVPDVMSAGELSASCEEFCAAPAAGNSLSGGITIEEIAVLTTHLDDCTPEWYSALFELLFAAGALDVAVTPAQMKKNRPGHALTVLCHPALSHELARLILQHSPALGVRCRLENRYVLPRREEKIATPLGEVTVKIAYGPDGSVWHVKPAADEVKELAVRHGISVEQVLRLVWRCLGEGVLL